ncbi:MAG: SRPBCC family protein [Acidimicrobiia bacterium]|nr:SRPBCC family protein [Acidimicrobiia bacterium]
MRHISVERSMPVSRSSVWSVLADFPNIAGWNSGVTNSFSTSESTSGIGARRHCDLSPTGTLEETIRVWEPEHRLVVSIDSATRLPIRKGEAAFTLTDDGDRSTTTIDYRYETKWGVVGSLMGPLLDTQLTKGMNGFLADLEAAAAAS